MNFNSKNAVSRLPVLLPDRFAIVKKSVILLALMTTLFFRQANGQTGKAFTVVSPDGNLKLEINAGKSISWSLWHKDDLLIEPSEISMTLATGEVWGRPAAGISSSTQSHDAAITALNYKKAIIQDRYNELTLRCRGDYGIIFRAYNAGIAWRFFSKRSGEIRVKDEQADFNFPDDYTAYIPYVNDPHNHDIYETSFENTYQHITLSQMIRDTLAFAPILVDAVHEKKIVITEADVEDYPGMFLRAGQQPHSLSGRYAPAALEEKQGGHNDLQAYVTRRAGYIAATTGSRNFPWRVAIVSTRDADLLNNDIIYSLAAPSRVANTSWIRPGKVAWDWWNDWNISHVGFRAGINTETYQYYIDFAAANHIEYVLLDEGWADSNDILKVVPEVDLAKIVEYGRQKNVGVWLWGGWLPMDQKMDDALKHYSAIGIKGFKIDFMDRDDQKMVQFYYRLAAKAASYKIMLDFHGAYKPTGLQRTYPNVVNFEGVWGLENAKWSSADMPAYVATIPFIRMVAGPLDYTPGAMSNASKKNFRPINQSPMSQGTRCQQLAMYVVFEAPFEMLCDNPTAYMKEVLCLDFISRVPTTFDETVALDGKVGEFAAIARRKGESWYLGALTNWEARDLSIDLSFLGTGVWEAEIFKDGINADRDGTDFASEIVPVTGTSKMTIHLAEGGGFVARFERKR